MLSKFDFLLPSIYFTIVGFLGAAFFFVKGEDKEVSVKAFVIYSLVTLLVFALMGLTGLMEIASASSFFMGLQACVLIFGIVHVLTLYRLNAWSDQESFLHELVFTAYIAMLGALAFLVVFALTNKQGYALIFTSSFIFFLVPFLVVKCFDFMLMIPAEVYPLWYHPTGEVNLELPDEMMEEDSIIVIEFQMATDLVPEAPMVKSRSKLPLKMELSRFFPIFLDAYNDRNPGNQIKFFDENNQPYAWNFYVKPKWYQFARYINPELTIRENDLKENDIIIAERV